MWTLPTLRSFSDELPAVTRGRTIFQRIPAWRAGFCIFVLIALIYSNTLDAQWHLDDYNSILKNRNIQIQSLAPRALAKTAYVPFYGTERLSRPLPMLSFALNWYAHGADPAGYHLVNITIHFLTALLLYLTIATLLQKAPRLKGAYGGQGQFIALLATLLWAANPIQTQAVTYIVQRMATMAAMFYGLALWLYVKGRIRPNDGRRYRLWLASLAAFAAGLASKENAVLLPLAIFLIELTFFQELNRSIVRHGRFWLAAILGLAFIAGSALMFLNGDLSWVLKGYNNRPFDLSERLMTQPRVIWFYLSLLFYPIPSRLSIEHDFVLSTGLLQPWTTLPALIGVASLMLIGLACVRRQPLLSFALLFFFLNHAVESSILPLEMVFEHRNYLPSMFLFVPVAAVAVNRLAFYRQARSGMYHVLVGFGVLVMMGWGMGTYIRNMTWATEATLWRDAQTKAPQAQRPIHNLAWAHYEKIGDLDTAYALYQEEQKLQRQQKIHAALSFNNMANINYQRGNYPEAAAQWREAARLAPRNPNYLYRQGLALFQARQMDAAIGVADRLMKKKAKRNDALLLKGQALLWQHKPERALVCFRKVFERHPESTDAAEKLGVAHLIAGHATNASILLAYARHQDPAALRPLVWLARISYIQGDQAGLKASITRLTAGYTVYQIRAELKAASEAMLLDGVDPAAMDAAIMQALIADA